MYSTPSKREVPRGVVILLIVKIGHDFTSIHELTTHIKKIMNYPLG